MAFLEEKFQDGFAAEDEVSQMSDEQLLTTWKALGENPWPKDDMKTQTLSMDDWAEIVYSEKTKRGL